MQWDGRLSVGSIRRIYDKDTSLKPTVQIINIKKLSPNSDTNKDRYRLIISDSQLYYQAMLATQHNELIANNVISEYCIVKLEHYICNLVQQRRILIILDLQPIHHGPGHRIGDPMNIEQAGSLPPQQQSMQQQQPTMQQQQPPMQQQQPPMQQQQPPMQQQQQSYRNMQQQQFQQPHRQEQQYSMYSPKPQMPNFSNRGPVATNSNAAVYTPILNLNPYNSSGWTIKARVTAKTDMKQWRNTRSEGNLFSFDILDKEGTEMRCTAFGDTADKFFPLFNIGQVYTICRGKIVPAKKQYTHIKNEYELQLDRSTKVEFCPDDAGICDQSFQFVPIDKLSEIEKNEYVDVVGIVNSCQPMSSIVSKASGNNVNKRSLTLVDKSGRSVDATLWGPLAEQIDETRVINNVITIKGARTSAFGGTSLNVGFNSRVEVNPDRPEVAELAGWFNQMGGNVTASSISGERTMGSGGPTPRKTFLAIKNEGLGQKPNKESDWFTIKGTIMLIPHDMDKPPWYNACASPNCNKKVERNQKGLWVCEKCQKEAPNCEPRFILSMSVADFTGASWVSCFNDVGQQLLGATAQDLQKTREMGMEKDFAVAFTQASFKQYMFKCRAHTEMVRDEPRMKISIHSVNPLDIVQESSYLIEEINKFN